MVLNQRSYLILRIIVLCAVVVLLAMCIHPFLTAWLGSLTQQYALTKTWKEIALVILLMASGAFLLHRKQLLSVVVRDRINQIIFLYAILHIVLALIFYRPNEPEAVVAGLMFNLRFLGIFLILRLIHFLLPKDRTAIIEKVTQIFLITAVGVAIFGILQVTVLPRDFLTHFGYTGVLTISPYSTVDDNSSFLRAFSTQRGPNTLGSFLLLPFALFLVNCFKREKLKFSVFGLLSSGIAIYLTYSRSAVLAMIIVAAVVAIIMERKKLKKILAPLLIGVGVVAVALGVLVASVPAVRLYVFHSSPGDSSLVEGSTNDHLKATVDNAGDAIRHPLGQGPGSAGPASFYLQHAEPKIAENYFVQIAQEVGILGLAIFAALSTIVGWVLFRMINGGPASSLIIGLFSSFIGINVINFLLHGWADDPTSIVWWGFAAMVIPFTQVALNTKAASASPKKAVS